MHLLWRNIRLISGVPCRSCRITEACLFPQGDGFHFKNMPIELDVWKLFAYSFFINIYSNHNYFFMDSCGFLNYFMMYFAELHNWDCRYNLMVYFNV